MQPRKMWMQESARLHTKQATITVMPMQTKESNKSMIKGLVVLGKWIAGRLDQYKELMGRVHKMIVVITLVGKMEGGKDETSKRYC